MTCWPGSPDARLLLGSGPGCWVRARGAGREEALDAEVHQRQQLERPRRAGRLALLASGAYRKALQMAQDGIYDLRIHHDEILWPLLRSWSLFSLEGLDPEAEQARERLAAHLAKTDRLASRFEAKRMRAAEAQERAS